MSEEALVMLLGELFDLAEEIHGRLVQGDDGDLDRAYFHGRLDSFKGLLNATRWQYDKKDYIDLKLSEIAEEYGRKNDTK